MSEDMGINIGRYGCDSMERWGMDDICVITFAMFTMSNITKLQITNLQIRAFRIYISLIN